MRLPSWPNFAVLAAFPLISMKRLLKWLGFAVTGLAALLIVVAVTVYFSSSAKLEKKHVVNVLPVAIPSDAAAVARGRHIAETRGCADCHGKDLAGAVVIDDPAMGHVAGPNLTRGSGGLPAGFGDMDLVRAIRHGVMPDGRGLYLMPSVDFSTLSDADMGALIAYLKSVGPVNRASDPVKLGPVARTLVALGKIQLDAEKIDHDNVRPAAVVPGATIEYGRYLAVGCTGCHGSNFSGGKIAIGPPGWPPAANLTPQAEAGIAKWSEEDFIKTLRTARRPDGTELNVVMPRAFGRLDEIELKALWAFLKTLPPAATGTR